MLRTAPAPARLGSSSERRPTRGLLAGGLGAGLLALLLAPSAQGLSLDAVDLRVTSSSETGSGYVEADGHDLAGPASPDTNPADGDLLLRQGDLELEPEDRDPIGEGSGGLTYQGASGDWRLSDWELEIEDNPFLGAIVAIANLEDHAQTFDIELDVPVAAVSPQSLLNGSVANVLDFVVGEGDLSDTGSPLYEARLDGADQGGATELVGASFSFPSSIDGESFSGFVGPPVDDTIGIHFRFELAPKTATLFSSKLNVVPVPEPSTLGLMSLGVAALALRRGRRRA